MLRGQEGEEGGGKEEEFEASFGRTGRMLRHIQNRLQHGSTLAVPKYFGPTYKFREYSQAMERHGGFDIYDAQALRILDPNLFHSFQSPVSDSRRAVIPIEGFEGISDKGR